MAGMTQPGISSRMTASRFLFALAEAGVRDGVAPVFRGVTVGVRDGVAGSAGFDARAVLLAPVTRVESR